MLTCDLKDLSVLSKEEILNLGWRCQRDFYLYILSLCDTLENANHSIWLLARRSHANGVGCENPGAFKQQNSDSEDFRYIADSYALIAENYDRIKKTYPEFEDFIVSISTAPSRVFFWEREGQK